MAIIPDTHDYGYVINNQVKSIKTGNWFPVRDSFFNSVDTNDKEKTRVNITVLEGGNAMIESDYIRMEISCPIKPVNCMGVIESNILYANGMEFHSTVTTRPNGDCEANVYGNVASVYIDGKYLGDAQHVYRLIGFRTLRGGVIIFKGDAYFIDSVDDDLTIYQHKNGNIYAKINKIFVQAKKL